MLKYSYKKNSCIWFIVGILGIACGAIIWGGWLLRDSQRNFVEVIQRILANARSLTAEKDELQISQFPGARLAFRAISSKRIIWRKVDWLPNDQLVLSGLTPAGTSPLYLGNINSGVMTPIIVDQQPVNFAIDFAASLTGEYAAYAEQAVVNKIRIFQLKQPGETELWLPMYGDIAWSPDGQQLAVLSNNAVRGIVTLRLFDRQGRELEQPLELADPRLIGPEGLSWSPDGQRIGFTLLWRTEQYKRQGDIYLLLLSNKQLIRLTASPTRDESVPSWSPDSQSFVFASSPIGRRGDGPLIFATADGSCMKPVPKLVGVDTPAWSPDGKQIAILSAGDVYILDIASLGEEFTTPLSCP